MPFKCEIKRVNQGTYIILEVMPLTYKYKYKKKKKGTLDKGSMLWHTSRMQPHQAPILYLISGPQICCTLIVCLYAKNLCDSYISSFAAKNVRIIMFK